MISEYRIPADWNPGEVFDQMSPPAMWHLPRDVWDKIHENTTGRSVVVAVLDTGLDDHSEFEDRIKDKKSFISGQSPADPQSGHGTHVMGTILGKETGVAPEATGIVGKVLSNQGSGGSPGIAEGIRWAVDAGADIINMSLGGGSSYGPTNQNIDYAWSKGCVVNVAAGNSGYRGSNTVGWPAKYINAICNGAIQRNGSIANFSSGGKELDWATPGQDIISTRNGGSGYQSMSGTSMATPFGCGVLALIVELMRKAGEPTWTAADSLRKFFQQFCDDKGDPGKDVRFGWGVPNYNKIVEALTYKDLQWL